MKWTDDYIDYCIGILKSNTDYQQALDEMNETRSALSHAFKRHGLKVPSSYLGLGGSSPSQTQPDLITTVVANDFHVPFHNENGVEALFDFCEDFQPDQIFINGDFLDCFSVSDFPKRPGKPKLQAELDIGIRLLEDLNERCPDAEKWYLDGNHEQRLERLIANNNGLHNLHALKIENLLELDRLGYTYHRYMDPVRVGNLTIVHGNSASKHSAYTAKKMLLDYGFQNVIVGHTHRLGRYFQTGFNGRKRAVENGGLFDKDQQDYCPIPNWQNGFCVAYQDKNDPEFLQIDLIEMSEDGAFIYNSEWYGK